MKLFGRRNTQKDSTTHLEWENLVSILLLWQPPKKLPLFLLYCVCCTEPLQRNAVIGHALHLLLYINEIIKQVIDNSFCFTVIGGNCTTDPDCIGLENSFCNTTMSDRPYCACKENFLAATNNTRCLTSKLLNSSKQRSYFTNTRCIL
jgi:hypothetical protein